MGNGRLEGKVAIVSGACRGMGRAQCLAMAKEGADIVACDVCKNNPVIKYDLGTKEELDKTVEDVKALGRKSIAVVVDITKADQVKALTDKAVKEFGKIDILVNTGGIVEVVPALEVTEEQWDNMLNVNLKGIWLMCKYTIPHMVKQNKGKIINISSTAGIRPYVGQLHYVAAKFGVIGITKVLALEFAKNKINVNAICPGPTDTPMLDKMGVYIGAKKEDIVKMFGPDMHLGLPGPEGIANATVYLASEESDYVTGFSLCVDSGTMLYK